MSPWPPLRAGIARVCFFSACAALLLSACSLLPARQETPDITGWSANGRPQTASSAGPAAAKGMAGDPAEDQACRKLAQTRMTDAAQAQITHLTEVELRHVYRLTYDQCLHWHDL